MLRLDYRAGYTNAVEISGYEDDVARLGEFGD